MPIVLRRQRGSQPQGDFRLRRDSPLFDGLALVALPPLGPLNLFSGYRGGYLHGVPVAAAGPGGIELNTSGNGRLLLSPNFASSSTPQSAIYDVSVLSALVITYQTSNQNGDYALGRFNGSGNPGWAVGLHSGSDNGPAARLGTYSIAGSGGTRRSAPTVVLLTGDGSNAVVYENGQVFSSGSYTAPTYDYSTFDGRSVLMGGLGSSGASQCRTSLGLFWAGRAIPPEIAALLVSPDAVWSLLVEPRRLWVPVSAGSGSDIDIAGVVGNAVASGVTGAPAVSIDIAGSVANAVAAGITGSTQVATEIAGSVGNAVAAGVAGSASVTNDISIDGVVGNAVAAGVAGDTSVGSDISISGTVGNAVAAGAAGVPGVSTTIAAAAGNATAAGVSGLAAIGVLIDGSVGDATAAGITGTLTLDIVVAGVVANAVAAGVTGSASVDAAAVSATPGYTIAAKARRLTITAAARRLEIRK